MNPPYMLFLPSQVLTIERATHRVQYLINLFRRDNGKLPVFVLPEDEALQTEAALESLISYVEFMEAFLVKLCMFFPDDVLRTVVAIIVCTHRQVDLLASRSSGLRCFVLRLSEIEAMTQNLDTLSLRLSMTLNWIKSEHGKQHRRIVNDALAGMHSSLAEFLRSPPPKHVPSQRDLSATPPSIASMLDTPKDDIDPEESTLIPEIGLTPADDLEILMQNYRPLSIARRRRHAARPKPPPLPRLTEAALQALSNNSLNPVRPPLPPLCTVIDSPGLRDRDENTPPPFAPWSPMRRSRKRLFREDGSTKSSPPRQTRWTSDEESCCPPGKRRKSLYQSPITASEATAVSSDSTSETGSDTDSEMCDDEDDAMVEEQLAITEEPPKPVPRRSCWLVAFFRFLLCR